jgi:integrase/recombinase XerD
VKLHDRCNVEGTDPPIQIGHRVKRKPGGAITISKKYTAQFSVGGRHRYESLGTNNKSVAIRKAHAIAQRIAEGEERIVNRRLDLANVVKEYLETLRDRGLAPKTDTKYTQVLDEFVDWYSRRGDGLANQFSEREFWAFSRWMGHERKRKLGPKTIEDRLTILKQLFKFAAKHKLIVRNPLEGVSVPEAPGTVQPCFSPDQVAALLSAADAALKPIFAMMAFTGMRFGEVRDVRWSDIQFDQGTTGFIVVQRGGSGLTTKNKKIRRIPMHPELRDIMMTLPRKFDRVFTSPPSARYPKGGNPLNEKTLIQKLKSLCAKCGFDNPDQYKLHTFRHVFASMCARNNVSYKYALTWMGHSSSEILDLYYSMFDETAELAMKTIQYSKPADKNKRKAG